MPSKIKREMTYGLIAGILVASLTTYAVLFAPLRDESQFPALLCVMLLGYGATVFFAWMIRACDTYLEVTDTHIVQHASNKPPLAFAWSDIAEVKNNTSMQRLELRSRSKKAVFMIEHQIEDFDALRQIVASKTGISLT